MVKLNGLLYNMRGYKLICCITVVLLLMSCSQGNKGLYLPGSIVPEKILKSTDPEAFFTCQEIPDTIFDLMQGRSYKEDCTVPRSDLRYLLILHCNFEGQAQVGEMVVNKSIASDVLEIMEQLFIESYPIEKVRLIDYYDADDECSMADNNTSCFNWRTISGLYKVSKHALGMAIDINPLYNPYYKFVSGKEIVQPVEAEEYVDRMSGYPYQIEEDDICYNLFVSHGFIWGGSWKSARDYQHFEK